MIQTMKKRKQTPRHGPAAKKRRKIPKAKKTTKRKILEVKKTIATPKTWKVVEPVGLDPETKTRLQHMRKVLQYCLQWPKRFLFVQEWYKKTIQPKLKSVLTLLNAITVIEKRYDEYEFASIDLDQEVNSKLFEARDGLKVIERVIKKYIDAHVDIFHAYKYRYAKRMQTWWKTVHPISIMNEEFKHDVANVASS